MSDFILANAGNLAFVKQHVWVRKPELKFLVMQFDILYGHFLAHVILMRERKLCGRKDYFGDPDSDSEVHLFNVIASRLGASIGVAVASAKEGTQSDRLLDFALPYDETEANSRPRDKQCLMWQLTKALKLLETLGDPQFTENGEKYFDPNWRNINAWNCEDYYNNENDPVAKSETQNFVRIFALSTQNLFRHFSALKKVIAIKKTFAEFYKRKKILFRQFSLNMGVKSHETDEWHDAKLRSLPLVRSEMASCYDLAEEAFQRSGGDVVELVALVNTQTIDDLLELDAHAAKILKVLRRQYHLVLVDTAEAETFCANVRFVSTSLRTLARLLRLWSNEIKKDHSEHSSVRSSLMDLGEIYELSRDIMRNMLVRAL
jgi:hypothetical protein